MTEMCGKLGEMSCEEEEEESRERERSRSAQGKMCVFVIQSFTGEIGSRNMSFVIFFGR